ncbi:MAG TPA: acyl-CoA dehydrogenase family protein [Candidatus Hydrogenedentes bacterium]|nr:acyl-CoA dehydrogenase family protein [Candidatus Hydrogenedentota bacterium]
MAQKQDAEKDKAMALAEDAREAEWKFPSFTAEMFKGNFRWDLVHPFPMQPAEDKKIGDELMEKTKKVLEECLDPIQVDKTGEYPKEALQKLAELGLFGMKISKDYDGLGLSVTNYARMLGFVGSYCQSTVTWLSAHQSIGVPQPLKDFGTEAQKKKYLPRLAKGEISAFALTEPDVGSDPARMTTTATLSEDGQNYILNGDKLWTTNGPDADIIVVMAKSGARKIGDVEIPEISAFIVETDWPGVEVVSRCKFMGLKGLSNGWLRFTDCKVPKENLIGKPGMGLKIALTTLNTGRLGVPAAGAGGCKSFIFDAARWAKERVQWGQSIGLHQAISKKLADFISYTYAMQAMVYLTCSFADKKNADIRLEAAAAKYFCTERVWYTLDDLLQVFGGRGYEMAESLYNRGEKPIWVERAMRDMRIGRIFEGSSEIMHLIMAREAMDTHFKLVMPILMPKKGQKEGRLSLMMKAMKFYAGWYPKTWMPPSINFDVKHLSAANRDHLKFAAKTCKKLARSLFHTMGKWQAKLEFEQILLGNFVDVGTELFVMAATLSFTEQMIAANPGDQTPQELCDLYCANARAKIAASFRAVKCNHNKMYKKIAKNLMDGKYNWLATDVYMDLPPSYRDYAKNLVPPKK